MFLNNASDSPYFSAMSETEPALLVATSDSGMYPAGTPPVVNVGSKIVVSNGAGVVEVPFGGLGNCAASTTLPFDFPVSPVTSGFFPASGLVPDTGTSGVVIA